MRGKPKNTPVKIDGKLTFSRLVDSIQSVHRQLAAQASKAVNMSLTLRNWLIGCYIREYEQNGADRAKYGELLFERLSEKLKKIEIPRTSARELRRYRLFYSVYPQIRETVSPKSAASLEKKLDLGVNASQIVRPVAAQSHIYASELVRKLSFSHIAELLSIGDDTKRAFYEIECIRGNWSVRELKRQIGSLYYERSGLSKNKKKLAELVKSGAEKEDIALNVRDPYIFEFLGLKPKEVMGESVLEDELLNKLQDFLLELGNGFCFEARQKRILIGDNYNFIDMVFYHRILKCHVLVELKVAEFGHENIGQLNTYVSWYRENVMGDGDNPPVGILLCTKKDHALVKYALAGMDNNLFVSKYQLELPKKEEMQKFIEEQIKDV
jgi:predicted nuclease of restriction endonuclease-like (RecB) superfamily